MAASSNFNFANPLVTAATGTYEVGDGSPFSASILAFQLVKGASITLAPECSLDGTNWQTISAVPSNSTTTTTSITADGIWRVDLSGVRFRFNISAISGASTIGWKLLVG